MHQFGWISEREGNFFNLLQEEGVPRREGGRGDSNPGKLWSDILRLGQVRDTKFCMNFSNNARVRAFTVSELLGENQRGEGKIRTHTHTYADYINAIVLIKVFWKKDGNLMFFIKTKMFLKNAV